MSSESSKQDDCYLVLLKVQYGIAISEFFEKLGHSFDYRPNGKTIRTYTTY